MGKTAKRYKSYEKSDAPLPRKVGGLRVWHITNPFPNEGVRIPVPDVATALIVLDRRIAADLRNPRITDNAFGLEEWDGTEWCEWYSVDGMDIMELMDERDRKASA